VCPRGPRKQKRKVPAQATSKSADPYISADLRPILQYKIESLNPSFYYFIKCDKRDAKNEVPNIGFSDVSVVALVVVTG